MQIWYCFHCLLPLWTLFSEWLLTWQCLILLYFCPWNLNTNSFFPIYMWQTTELSHFTKVPEVVGVHYHHHSRDIIVAFEQHKRDIFKRHPLIRFVSRIFHSCRHIKRKTFYVTGPLWGESTGQWREALTFSLICTWTNGWANNRDAGDLRYHHDQYDVTVM